MTRHDAKITALLPPR